MATFRIPILVWQDFNNTFTAQAITGDDTFPPVAFAESRDLAKLRNICSKVFVSKFWTKKLRDCSKIRK